MRMSPNRFFCQMAVCESFDCGFEISDFGLEKDGLPVAGYGSFDCGFEISDFGLEKDGGRVAGYGSFIADLRFRILDWKKMGGSFQKPVPVA